MPVHVTFALTTVMCFFSRSVAVTLIFDCCDAHYFCVHVTVTVKSFATVMLYFFVFFCVDMVVAVTIFATVMWL